MRTKNVYVLMLALVIVLSGCFGNTADDADGQSNNSNITPLIEIGQHQATGGTPAYSSSTGELLGFTEWNVSIYRAIADLDGTIVSAGWDFDLDGTIDHPSTAFQSIDNLSIPSIHWTNASTVYAPWVDEQIATIAFIATDDSGDTSGQLVTISNDDVFDFTWLGLSTRNSYTAVDADASTSSADDDTLMRISWQHADLDLEWSLVVIKLTVGDMTYDCSIGAGDDCQITQDGSDTALWEKGEFLTLAENGVDIASGTTEISMYVTYRGTMVAGSSSVTVA